MWSAVLRIGHPSKVRTVICVLRRPRSRARGRRPGAQERGERIDGTAVQRGDNFIHSVQSWAIEPSDFQGPACAPRMTSDFMLPTWSHLQLAVSGLNSKHRRNIEFSWHQHPRRRLGQYRWVEYSFASVPEDRIEFGVEVAFRCRRRPTFIRVRPVPPEPRRVR